MDRKECYTKYKHKSRSTRPVQKNRCWKLLWYFLSTFKASAYGKETFQ
jgi:hypothetical protein